MNNGKKQCVLYLEDEMEEFHCPRKEGENTKDYSRRRLSAAERFIQGKGFCPFKAEANAKQKKLQKTTVWTWKIWDNGKNYYPHTGSCTCVGKVTGDLLE